METPAATGTAQVPARVIEMGRRAEIKALNMIQCLAKVTDIRVGDTLSELDITLRGSGTKHTDPRTLLCLFGLDVDPKTPQPEGRRVAHISCDYAVLYEISDEAYFDSLTVEDIENFAAFNGSFNAWPFAREFVHNVVTRLGLPPVLLPLYRPAQMLPTRDKWTKAPRSTPPE